MRAVTYHHYGSPDVLEVEEVAKPTPGEDEVLLRLHAAAVTTADVAARKGDPFLMRLFIGLRGPKKRTLGTEFAGQVEAVGSKVTRFVPGDQVWAATGVEFGAHADYLSLPEDGALARKPEALTYEDATSISEGALTALPFLRDKGRIKPGQRVLINGASGSVGTSAVQLAKAFGAEVTAVCSATNVELVRSLGADEIIDYTTEDFTANGRTYDIIFDAVGKSSFSKCKDSLSERGVYLTTVLSRGTLVQGLWTAVFGGKKAVFSATGLRKPADKARDLEFLSGLVEQGSLRPVIDRSYSLEQAAEAHRYVEAGHKKGNVIFTVVPHDTASDASPATATV